ncbi:hypothetical protein OH77DRAFT_1430035 [Trametes cingulata]|nr:hypothetical protein OH77DRAFT_1430035 [Trametes cingulata]
MFSSFSFGAAPFDLPNALKTWGTSAPDHPVPEFKGKPKRKDDPSPAAWLNTIEKGCTARSVPKAHWPAVAKHFMGKKARGRVLEVEKVMRALHGEQWEWRWKDFRVAVMNMGCECLGTCALGRALVAKRRWVIGNIEETKTREVHVERKPSGLWWIPGSKDEASAKPSAAPKTASKPTQAPKKVLADTKPPNKPSDKPSGSKLLSKPPTTKTTLAPAAKEPKPARTGSLFSLPALPFLRQTPTQQTVLQKITAQVPLWLLSATEALSTLSNEHPDVLTAVATALVAVGTVSAGGSAAVAAIGEAAVIVGRAIKTAHDRTHTSAR